ncbi:extracellular solute-binding protein [Streptomyces sp. NPDC045431]|uniref:extracellular solute-binding protein n=1 Tax=Streptomyces sp. NPDC045431 TaxID=3155613 RepID=UPI0033DBDA06
MTRRTRRTSKTSSTRSNSTPRTIGNLTALAASLLLTCLTTGASAASPDTAPRHLKVWFMWGSVPAPVVDRLVGEFEAAHPGVEVDVELQSWVGIQERLEAALASGDSPDVVELGTTTTPSFASAGLLKDLSAKADALGSREWIPSLRESGNWQGKQYGVPLYAASRVVIYRTDLFAQAGLDTPRDQKEWVRTTRALGRAHQADPGFQPIYLPGQNWYVLSGLLHDRGGRLATHDGTRWHGGLATAEAASALKYYRTLQSLSQAPKDRDEAHPFQYEELAKGGIGQMVGLPWELADAERINPALRGKLGMFPVPGLSADRPGSVFLGGSNLAVSARSAQPEAALEWVAGITGPEAQKRIAAANGTLPNRLALAREVDSPVVRVQAEAAANGHTTPVDPRWPLVEAEPNPVKTLLTDVLTGQPARAAGRRADLAVEERLNGTPPPSAGTPPSPAGGRAGPLH